MRKILLLTFVLLLLLAPWSYGRGGGHGEMRNYLKKVDTDITPSKDNAYDIGTAGKRVRNFRAVTLYGDATNLTGLPAASSITNGTAPTVDAAGEIAIDTTDDQLLYYGGAERVVTYKQQKCFAIEDPVIGDDNIPVFFPTDAITVTNIYCLTQGGTSAGLFLSDGTNALDTVVCDGDGQADDGAIANAAFTANERVECDTDAVTGAVDWVTLCFTYTTTKE